jgi:hypothetical protein
VLVTCRSRAMRLNLGCDKVDRLTNNAPATGMEVSGVAEFRTVELNVKLWTSRFPPDTERPSCDKRSRMMVLALSLTMWKLFRACCATGHDARCEKAGEIKASVS